MYKPKFILMEKNFFDGSSGGCQPDNSTYNEILALYEKQDINLEIIFSKTTGVSHFRYEEEICNHNAMIEGRGIQNKYPELKFTEISLDFIRINGKKVSAKTSYTVSGKREDVKRFAIIEHGNTSESFEEKYPLSVEQAKMIEERNYQLKIHPDKLSMFESSLQDFKSRNSNVSFILTFKKMTNKQSILCKKLNVRHDISISVTAPSCMFTIVDNIIDHCRKRYFHGYKHDFKKNEDVVRI